MRYNQSRAGMDPEERRKRHELSYGVYNFRDVKLHFSRQGWTFRPGPSLSYNHYYIKPGKNPRNKQHKQGVDYFLGEAELVAYARKMRIFGDETVPLPAPINAMRPGKRRARSSSSVRTSQTTMELNSEISDSEGERRVRHKCQRQRSPKVGNSAMNPIALLSDSSEKESSIAEESGDVDSVEEDEDEEWTEGETTGGFHIEEEEEDEEEEDEEMSDEEMSSSSFSEDDDYIEEPESADDLATARNAKKAVKPSTGKRLNTETHDVNGRENGKVNAQEKAPVKAEVKPDTLRDDFFTSSSENEENSVRKHKRPRPLLTTSHKKKRNALKHTSKRLPTNDLRNRSSDRAQEGSRIFKKNKKAAASFKKKHQPLQNRNGKKAKSALRNLLQDSSNDQCGKAEDNDDNNFSLDVEEYGESPPRRPPSRLNSRANSVRSSPATSIVALSPPPEEEKEDSSIPPSTLAPPSPEDAAAAVSTISHSFLSPSASARRTSTVTSSSQATTAQTPATPSVAPSSRPKTGLSSVTNAAPTLTMTPPVPPSSDVNVVGTSAQVSMELTQVVLPPDCDNRYHIRVTVSTNKPPVYTIWMRNLATHEEHESRFVDVTELPGAKTDIRVPTATVLTALFRCLSTQLDAVVIVGPESRATAESKASSEKGEVQLQTSTAEKNPGDADANENELMLIVAYPALDLFRVDHHFPMKLVSSIQRLQDLTKEVKHLKEQLALVQSDRDKLCEQLQLQEEENERTLALQLEARVKARIEAQSACQPSKEELEKRVAKAVEEKTWALEQIREKEKRDRDCARRWVFARSDWMVAFQPCQTLATGITTETETSLLRPVTAASARKYVVEWKEVVEIAEPFFQPVTSGSVRSIAVVKDGFYQVNANVSHDSSVELRLVIHSVADVTATPRELEPTKVLLYDNKRRVSRVDTMLELRAFDQLSLELQLLDSIAAPSQQQEWLRTPMPTHNRFLVVVLEEHAV